MDNNVTSKDTGFKLVIRPFRQDFVPNADDAVFSCDARVAFQPNTQEQAIQGLTNLDNSFASLHVKTSRDHSLETMTKRELAKDSQHEDELHKAWADISNRNTERTLGNFLKNAVDFVHLANKTNSKLSEQYLIEMDTGQQRTRYSAQQSGEGIGLELTQLEASSLQPVRDSAYMPKKFNI